MEDDVLREMLDVGVHLMHNLDQPSVLCVWWLPGNEQKRITELL